MRRVVRVRVLLSGAVGAVLLGVGVVYLTVACQNLPGILGPHPGDRSPRYGLGIVAVVLGLAFLAATHLSLRRRPPGAPLHP
jgi:amino acid permease